MVTTDWAKFREYKDNGLVKDVFTKKSTMDKLQGALAAAAPACGSCSLMRSQLPSWLAQAQLATCALLAVGAVAVAVRLELLLPAGMSTQPANHTSQCSHGQHPHTSTATSADSC